MPCECGSWLITMGPINGWFMDVYGLKMAMLKIHNWALSAYCWFFFSICDLPSNQGCIIWNSSNVECKDSTWSHIAKSACVFFAQMKHQSPGAVYWERWEESEGDWQLGPCPQSPQWCVDPNRNSILRESNPKTKTDMEMDKNLTWMKMYLVLSIKVLFHVHVSFQGCTLIQQDVGVSCCLE